MRLSRLLPLCLLGFSALAQAAGVTLKVDTVTIDNDPSNGQQVINIRLAPEATQALRDFTTERVGQQVALQVDGIQLMTARLAEPLEVAELQLTPGIEGMGGLSIEQISSRLATGGALTMETIETP